MAALCQTWISHSSTWLKFVASLAGLLLDEILIGDQLNRLALHYDKIPECVRLILIVNPFSLSCLPALPECFLHVNLTTPYRSTIAITSLARFIGQCEDRLVPEEDFRPDVTRLLEVGLQREERERRERQRASAQEVLWCHRINGDGTWESNNFPEW